MFTHNGKIYLFANWKMYLDYDESNILANALARGAKKFGDKIQMAIFPSTLSLYPVGQVLRDVGIGVGAQNVYWVDKGGYTGEVSAAMYRAVGCEYTLIGHSERRHQFGETDHDVREKMKAALASGLTPVLCVGETEQQRNTGKTEEVVEVQLRAAFDGLNWPKDKELIVAYEPVWAIGAGVACDPDEAMRMHELIIKICKNLIKNSDPVVLYGGSVRPNNVVGYLSQPAIDGVLVGAASTKLDEWLEIISAAQEL